MPIVRQPEIQKAKSRDDLVKRFTAAEDRSKEAIGRAKTLEKNLTVALERITKLERAHSNTVDHLSDAIDNLRLKLTCAGFIIAAIVATIVIYCLKLARVF